jgi:hypothetical protein
MARYTEFPHPNMTTGFECPICKTGADQPVVLVGIPGTEDDGIMQARQVHSECLKVVSKMNGITIEVVPMTPEKVKI